MKAHQLSIGKDDEWLTPPSILRALGQFDLDPCAPSYRPWPMADKHYTAAEDGLSSPWHGRVWLNPPFDRFTRPLWMSRMADHNNGIMLVPAACETKAFADSVFGRCSGLLMLGSRPRFHYVDGSQASANSGCTIALVAYGDENLDALRASGLGFVLVEA